MPHGKQISKQYNLNEGTIGVIVPVYKVEKYIAECIESILSQTYTNFRLILINDGTPDNAGKICDEYAKKDPRITVIHQENGGVTRARARGVEEAKDCEFITFVDGDDTIPCMALNNMASNISADFDILIASRQDISMEDCIVDAQKYRSMIILEKIPCGPVAKLFKRKLFTSNTFDVDKRIIAYEDLIMNILLSLQTPNKIKIISNVTYLYRNNADSSSHNFKDNDNFEVLLYESLKASIPEKKLDIHIHDIIEHFLHRWDKQFGYNSRARGWDNWQIRKLILDDIKKYHHKTNTIRKLIFSVRTPLFKTFLIGIRKVLNTIKK